MSYVRRILLKHILPVDCHRRVKGILASKNCDTLRYFFPLQYIFIYIYIYIYIYKAHFSIVDVGNRENAEQRKSE